jgi:hypothetical protein
MVLTNSLVAVLPNADPRAATGAENPETTAAAIGATCSVAYRIPLLYAQLYTLSGIYLAYF